MEKKKTTPFTWIITIILFALFFYLSYCMFSDIKPFESRSSKCKTEAQDRAVNLRNAKLKSLKLKEEPTEEERLEIEALEIDQKANLVNRDDYDYFYKDCMR